MAIHLAGDIGGTKTILRLVHSEAAGGQTGFPKLKTLHEQTYVSQEFPDLVPMVQTFLTSAADQNTQSPIETACFGIAGPVVNHSSNLTNLNWSLAADRLERDLAIAHVTLINDFAAIGYGVLGLSPEDLCPLQDVPSNPKAPIAVLGAGTGLGQSFLIPLPNGHYRVCGSEGAHADFPSRTPLEDQLLCYLRQTHALDRVSVERVVSGQGIASIYAFLRDRNPAQESPEMANLYQTWQREQGLSEKTVDMAAEVSQAALEKGDSLCQRAMNVFVEAYGAEAGNLALKLLPYGGLYVAGGIAPKILPLLQQGNFMQAFRSKGRLSSLQDQFPVHVVLNPKVGLIGAALYASTHERTH